MDEQAILQKWREKDTGYADFRELADDIGWEFPYRVFDNLIAPIYFYNDKTKAYWNKFSRTNAKHFPAGVFFNSTKHNFIVINIFKTNSLNNLLFTIEHECIHAYFYSLDMLQYQPEYELRENETYTDLEKFVLNYEKKMVADVSRYSHWRKQYKWKSKPAKIDEIIATSYQFWGKGTGTQILGTKYFEEFAKLVHAYVSSVDSTQKEDAYFLKRRHTTNLAYSLSNYYDFHFEKKDVAFDYHGPALTTYFEKSKFRKFWIDTTILGLPANLYAVQDKELNRYYPVLSRMVGENKMMISTFGVDVFFSDAKQTFEFLENYARRL